MIDNLTSTDLIESVREFIAGATRCKEAFNRLALQLFDFQFHSVAPYRRFCEARKTVPSVVKHWTQIPAVPTLAFKEFKITSLPERERTSVFYSSGTTRQERSRHFHNEDSLGLYELSLITAFEQCILRSFPPLEARSSGRKSAQFNPREISGPTHAGCHGPGVRNATGLREKNIPAKERRNRILALTPPLEEVPNSSLAHMFGTVIDVFGDSESVSVGKVNPAGDWEINFNAAIEALTTPQSILLLGTAFNFVHLTDHLREHGIKLQLPEGPHVLETGGYKGRSRELSKSELHETISAHLGIPTKNIICEYGMSELSSQAYDCVGHERNFQFPHWARAVIVSPETGNEVAIGETGLIRIFDLANVNSVMAIQTEDLAIRRENGFNLLGRAKLAESRGCSLMTA